MHHCFCGRRDSFALCAVDVAAKTPIDPDSPDTGTVRIRVQNVGA